METLGVWLRRTREAREDTLEQVEESTRIRTRFLRMMEAGDFAAFPGGEVQVRGFLRIYARYLGVSADEVLTRYDTEGSGPSVAPSLNSPLGETKSSLSTHIPSEPSSFRTRGLSSTTTDGLVRVMIVGIIVVVLVGIAATVGYLMMQNSDQRPAAVPTSPVSPAASALSEVEPAQEGVETPAPDTHLAPFPVSSDGTVEVTLDPTEHVWVRVIADGPTVFEGLLSPAQPKSWSGGEVIIVDVGNGAGLRVTVNGQLQGEMCGRGELCTRAWGPDGEVALPSLSPRLAQESEIG